MKRNFAVFILTHGRADKIITYKTLKRQGYNGKIYFVCDDEDKQLEKYKNNFGEENILIFNKQEIANKIDTMDNLDKMNVILFARNACFNFAQKLNLTHFLELDDDYTEFMFRLIYEEKLYYVPCKNLSKLFDKFLDCLDNTNADTIALAQGGDFIGGINGKFTERVLRKAMNSFFCKTNKPFEFLGRINEDVNTYTLLGSKGKLFFTATEASLTQLQTQSNKGGMTETYIDNGTYIKSFYSVICMPSAVKVSMIGSSTHDKKGHYRIHHNVNWNNCVPKIIEEKYEK